MKKIYILAFSLTTISSVFAQSPYERQQTYPDNNRNDGYSSSKGEVYNNNRNGAYGSPAPVIKVDVYSKDNDRRGSGYDRRYNEQYSYTLRERDTRIFQINREYENRMNYIRYNRYMSNSAKRWELRKLENQREQEIKVVYVRFDNYRNKYNDRYYDRNFNWRS